MMSITMLQDYTAGLSRIYQEMITQAGVTTGAIVPGTLRDLANRILDLTVVDSDDYFVEKDFNEASYSLSQYIVANQVMLRNFSDSVTAVETHYGEHGSDVDSTIETLQTMLAYYNGGTGGVKYANMIDPYYSDLVYDLSEARPAEAWYYYGKAIHPLLNSTAVNGMATKDVAGTFTAGTAYDANYAELALLVEVVTDFTGGGAAPVISIAGVDGEASAATTWGVTLDSNNPVAAVSTTITPAVAIMARQTVALASASGIVAGSVLTINSGLIDQEIIVVEVVAGSDITAVFRKAHLAGAAVTGNRTYTATPSVALRRARSVSGITLTLSGHGAGKVRVVGRQDRVAI